MSTSLRVEEGEVGLKIIFGNFYIINNDNNNGSFYFAFFAKGKNINNIDDEKMKDKLNNIFGSNYCNCIYSYYKTKTFKTFKYCSIIYSKFIFNSSRHGLFFLSRYTSISVLPIVELQFAHVAIKFLMCLNPPFFFEIICAA